MITIQNGNTFQLSRDGTQLVCGYETVKHVDLRTGVETPWPLNGQGAFYPCGWLDDNRPAVFQPTKSSPPVTQAYGWGLPDTMEKLGVVDQAIGHAGLAIINGRVLSTNGQRIWHNGVDITPEPFLGVVWSGEHYGYKRGWDGGGPFVVRRVSDNMIVREIDQAGRWEQPYTLSDGVWVSGQYPGGSRVYPPNHTQVILLPERELAGPVFDADDGLYVVSAVMGGQQNPRGVMVRPLWQLAEAEGRELGWYVDGIRHQQLQARVTPEGHFVIAGSEFPGSGVITIGEIDPASPMGLVPPETVDPPIDPPVDPPDGGDMTEAQYLALVAKVNEAVDAARAAESAAKAAQTAAVVAFEAAQSSANLAGTAVSLVTDAPVRIPYLGVGRLNPK